MPRYEVQKNYGSGQHGPWEPGDEVELTEEEAEWINRDSDGILTLASTQDRPATVEEKAAERRNERDQSRGRAEPPAEPEAAKPAKKSGRAKKSAAADAADDSAHSTEDADGLTKG